jgi:hypothetical protein
MKAIAHLDVEMPRLDEVRVLIALSQKHCSQRRSDPEARSPSGIRRAGGVAVLRDPYKDSWGVTKTEVIVVAASVTTLAC